MKDCYTYRKEPKEEDMTTPEWVLRNYWVTLKKDPKARHEALTVFLVLSICRLFLNIITFGERKD